jgi:ABC-type transporter Mla subunit MlaD
VAALALASAACATRGDIDALMVEHQRVLERQDDLQAQLDGALLTLARMEQLLTQIRADFKADLGAVRTQMNAVESALRGTETRIEQLRRYTPAPQPVPADTTEAAIGDVDPIALYNAAITDYQRMASARATRSTGSGPRGTTRSAGTRPSPSCARCLPAGRTAPRPRSPCARSATPTARRETTSAPGRPTSS